MSQNQRTLRVGDDILDVERCDGDIVTVSVSSSTTLAQGINLNEKNRAWLIEAIGGNEREGGLELALQLMGASAQGLAGTTNQLIDNLTAERDELEATLAAVRGEVSALLYGQYMPTPETILKALGPLDKVIDMYRRATAE